MLYVIPFIKCYDSLIIFIGDTKVYIWEKIWYDDDGIFKNMYEKETTTLVNIRIYPIYITQLGGFMTRFMMLDPLLWSDYYY